MTTIGYQLVPLTYENERIRQQTNNHENRKQLYIYNMEVIQLMSYLWVSAKSHARRSMTGLMDIWQALLTEYQ